MKRIFIELKIFNEGLISYNLNHKISSFIYSLLSEDLPEIHNTKKSNFTFSNIMFENFTPQKNGMKLKSNKGVVIISTTNEKIVDVLINNIKYNKNYQLDNFYFNIINIKLDSDKILNDVVCFKTITPICLTKAYIREDGKLRQKFLSPHDDEYKEYFLKNILNKTDRNISDIDFEINLTTVKSKRITIKENQTITGYMFDFVIRCSDINLLNKAYFDGFGSKNAQGFGLVNLIRQ